MRRQHFSYNIIGMKFSFTVEAYSPTQLNSMFHIAMLLDAEADQDEIDIQALIFVVAQIEHWAKGNNIGQLYDNESCSRLAESLEKAATAVRSALSK